MKLTVTGIYLCLGNSTLNFINSAGVYVDFTYLSDNLSEHDFMMVLGIYSEEERTML